MRPVSEFSASIVGVGKLGAAMIGAISSRGITVVGIDIDPKRVEMINNAIPPVHETDLADYMLANRERISATTSYDEAVAKTDITFVVVQTPSDPEGFFRLDFAASAFRELGKALAKKDGYHLVVLTSTVLPGATRKALLPILEEESGKRAGEDFGLCYSPEFIALGTVIRDFLNPDFLLVGELDQRSGDTLERAYSQIVENGAPSKRMSLENAELTKISVNSFVTTKITFANMLADLCERIPGGDIDVVTDALGFDRRIGRRYLTGGLGYGGPCFPRDNVALCAFAQAAGTDATISSATDMINDRLVDRIMERLEGVVEPGTRVAVLGLAYKPFSEVVEESQGLEIARRLADVGAEVSAYDPLAGGSAARALGDSVRIADSIADCLNGAQVVLVSNADPAFKDLKAADLDLPSEGKLTFVDFWRTYGELASNESIDYMAAGRSRNDAENEEALDALWRSRLAGSQELARA
jgi:UDPglucose 6-dehydrogenase